MNQKQSAALIVQLLLVHSFTFALAVSAEPADWLRNSGDQLEMRIHGEVFDANGQPAVDFAFTGSLRNMLNKDEPFKPTITGNRFEAWLPVNANTVFASYIHVTSSDGNQAAIKTVVANEFRQAAIDGIKLKLQDANRHVTVSVMHDGKPVPDAIVKIETLFGLERRAFSNKSGKAHLKFIGAQNLSRITVWTDDRRIGGFSFDREPTRDPNLSDYKVEISKCRDFKMRFVDENGSPVSDVPFRLQIATPAPNYNFIGTHDHEELKTNANGEAVYRWMPEWENHNYVELLTNQWILDEGRDTAGDVNVFNLTKSKIHQRKRIKGKLTSSETTVGGFQIQASSFQGEQENYSDRLSTFSNSDGSFEFDVLPGATYCFYPLDTHWAGGIIDLLPYDTVKQETTSPQLSISKGQTLEIVVDSGSQKTPIANLSINLRRPYSYTWRENGESRNGSGGPQWWVTTDAAGRASLQVLPGKVGVSVYSPLWRTRETVEIVAANPAKINLHRQEEHEKTVVKGRLVLSEGVDTMLDQVDIQIGSVDGKHNEKLNIKASAGGEFSFSTLATKLAFLAYSQDARSAGAIIAPDVNLPIEIQLRPTIDYFGQLRGNNDQPLQGVPVMASANLEGEDLYDDSAFSKTFRPKSFEARTDDKGNYRIVGIPAMTKIQITAKLSTNSESIEYLDKVFLEPNESRPVQVSNLGESAAQPPKLSLNERVDKVLRDCALSGFHLLVTASGSSRTAAKFVGENLTRGDLANVSSYMQLAVSSDKLIDSPKEAAYCKKRNWPLPTGDKIFVCAIDAADKELGRTEFDSSDLQAVEQAASFLAQHAPKKLDAEKKWQEAFEEAQRTNRKVWVRISSRYCGPCFTLSRWLDDSKELLAKDFVMLKIDNVRDENGQSAANRLTRGKHHGVPFHAIFDSRGEMVIDSAGPLGNIGHPSGFEGKKHLRKMLQAAQQSLTNTEIDQLVDSLTD